MGGMKKGKRKEEKHDKKVDRWKENEEKKVKCTCCGTGDISVFQCVNQDRHGTFIRIRNYFLDLLAVPGMRWEACLVLITVRILDKCKSQLVSTVTWT